MINNQKNFLESYKPSTTLDFDVVYDLVAGVVINVIFGLK